MTFCVFSTEQTGLFSFSPFIKGVGPQISQQRRSPSPLFFSLSLSSRNNGGFFVSLLRFLIHRLLIIIFLVSSWSPSPSPSQGRRQNQGIPQDPQQEGWPISIEAEAKAPIPSRFLLLLLFWWLQASWFTPLSLSRSLRVRVRVRCEFRHGSSNKRGGKIPFLFESWNLLSLIEQWLDCSLNLQFRELIRQWARGIESSEETQT